MSAPQNHRKCDALTATARRSSCNVSDGECDVLAASHVPWNGPSVLHQAEVAGGPYPALEGPASDRSFRIRPGRFYVRGMTPGPR